MPLAPGTRIGPYEVVTAIGSGGMGEVYRAHDPRLRRDVALKILPGDVAGDPARLERFTREARAVAALNHPHIVTIYSTEHAGSIRFFTMELIEGESLDRLIAPGGLPVRRFLSLAVPIADALTAAHQKHITHRDLKPANVMVTTAGHVKVLDFGLARLESAESAPEADATHLDLTGAGTVVGTMPYMSPEQVEGRPLDPRSDLFSLGVMFYEMLTGARPFAGESSASLMSSILRDAPTPLAELRPDVPDALARLIGRCLEKRPDDRVQTARDVYNELRVIQKQLESEAVRRSDSRISRTGSPEESLGMAVLPFAASGGDAPAIAEGLTEDITAALARFPYLSVVAQHATAQFRAPVADLRGVAERLGARYILDGTVRHSGTALRIKVRLVEATGGTQLWSETYARDLATSDVLAVQDDVTDRVVGTVADVHGVLLRSMTHHLRDRPVEELTAPALALRFWAYQRHQTADEHARLRTAFEQLVAERPERADAWALLAHLYAHEEIFGFNARPEALRRAHDAATRALDRDPVNQQAWEVLATTYFFEHDRDRVVHAVDRALALNPRNTATMAWVGNLLATMGDYDRGCELTERAMALNPDHPGWYHFAVFHRHYYRREFEEALRTAKKINMPLHLWSHWAVAIAAAQLGRAVEARAALDRFLALAPELADEQAMGAAQRRWKWDEASVELGIEGFRKAMALRATVGGAQPGSPPSSGDQQERLQAPGARTPSSGAGRATASAMRVLVLPVAARSAGEQAVALAEGLTDEITAGLSRFDLLRVVSRRSADRVKDHSDVRAAGGDVGARYVVEGTVRQAGTLLRVSARLIDVETGAHLWAENYDREAAVASFDLQDDVARRIVATVATPSGVLVRAMAATLKDLPIEEMEIPELVLRFHGYTAQFNPEEHARLRRGFEQALSREPSSAHAWACLAMLAEHEHSHGLNPLPDPVGRLRRAAERAVELDPMHQHAWMARASAAFFERDLRGLRVAVERAVAINPFNAEWLALAGIFLSCAGELSWATELARQASDLSPLHPGWYHFVPFHAAYAVGAYEDALLHAKRINMPMFLWSHLSCAAAAGQLGLVAEARAAIDGLAAAFPQMIDPARVRAEWGRWIWDPALLERLLEGLEKARALHSGPRGAVQDSV